MALKNELTGEYLKVINVRLEPMDADYIIFKDQEQRLRFESGLNPYETIRGSSYNGGLLDIELNKQADANLSIINNMKKATYSALKQDMFSNWIDA